MKRLALEALGYILLGLGWPPMALAGGLIMLGEALLNEAAESPAEGEGKP